MPSVSHSPFQTSEPISPQRDVNLLSSHGTLMVVPPFRILSKQFVHWENKEETKQNKKLDIKNSHLFSVYKFKLKLLFLK
jgi:hypothetical protein